MNKQISTQPTGTGKNSFCKQAHGFTLIEMMITMAVLSIGLLGLASLQGNSLKNNFSSYQRTLATIQAYDMVDRIRANYAGAASGQYDTITTTIPTDPACISSGCTVAQMATYDSYIWNTTNAQILPSGQGTVSRSGNMFTVQVMWDDERSGVTGTGCDPDDATDLKCFSANVSI